MWSFLVRSATVLLLVLVFGLCHAIAEARCGKGAGGGLFHRQDRVQARHERRMSRISARSMGACGSSMTQTTTVRMVGVPMRMIPMAPACDSSPPMRPLQ